MSAKKIVLYREGSITLAAGVRAAIDPELTRDGVNPANVDHVEVSGGGIVASIQGGTFDIQNITDAQQAITWSAQTEHTIQADPNQAAQAGVGPGGANPSPRAALVLPSGEDNTAEDRGGGAGLVLPKDGTILPFRTLTSPLGSISLVENGDELEIETAGPSIEYPQEPPLDGAFLYWKMQETGTSQVIVDSSPNGLNSGGPRPPAVTPTTFTANVTPFRDLPGALLAYHPNDNYSGYYQLAGRALSFETVLFLAPASIGDQFFNYAERTGASAYANVYAAMRCDTAGALQVFANGWVVVPTNLIRLDPYRPHPLGLYYIPTSPTEMRIDVWVDGFKRYESAPFVNAAVVGANHSVNFPNGGWAKGFYRVFDGERTDQEKLAYFRYFFPQLIAA